MTKDSVRLTSALSVLVDAKKHIDKWGSTAEDSGTELRTTRYFLQRAVNSYMCEVADTQAAALLLGMPSFYASERFVFSAGWQVLREALEALGVEPSWVTPEPEDDADDLHGGADVEDGETVQIGTDSAWTREQKEESLEGMGGPGNCKVYCDHEGRAHAVSDATNYRLRGFELDRLNAYEYKGCVTMVEMTSEEKEAAQAAHMAGEALTFEAKKRRGRLPNASVSVPKVLSPRSAAPLHPLSALRCLLAVCVPCSASLVPVAQAEAQLEACVPAARWAACAVRATAAQQREADGAAVEAAPQEVCRVLRRLLRALEAGRHC
jgi:hypothetical protein